MSDYIEYEVTVYSDGSKYWSRNGKLHRKDGPAVEYANGYKVWWLDGKRHREDGPAVEWSDGSKEWYLNGKRYTGSKHKAETARRNNTCNGKIVTIEGKEYTLNEVKK